MQLMVQGHFNGPAFLCLARNPQDSPVLHVFNLNGPAYVYLARSTQDSPVLHVWHSA